jgi:putative cardiolipin synthase
MTRRLPHRFLHPWAFGAILAVALAGCATRPPGSGFPKPASLAFAQPEQTQVGRQFAEAARSHPDRSAFRIISVGVDGFAARIQMIDAAERSLDLQYFIFRGDETGRLLSNALLRAADRGVKVRLLVDDAETRPGDDQVVSLAAHPLIEVRIFNPFAYRGHNRMLRTIEFTFNAGRLDYRMHNKLLVADNASALIGGRNIGAAYFQVDPNQQYADDDVFVAGPAVPQLSATFDEYWNSALATPVEALSGGKPTQVELDRRRQLLSEQWRQAQVGGLDYLKRAESGEPFFGIIQGRLPLVWSSVQVVCDSPDKKSVVRGSAIGRLLYEPVAKVAKSVKTELIMITPYFVPTAAELQLLSNLRQRNVRVRILTNSLASIDQVTAYSGYVRYRVPLLREGVELHEVRALPGSTRGSGQSAAITRLGNYGLHGKLFVFDRQKLFIGSMNFDQRSVRLNTEVGLIIDSPELAEQTAARLEAMTRPENAYSVSLAPAGGKKPAVLWRTQESGTMVESRRDPARSVWQRLAVRILTLLPIDQEL